MLNKNNGFMIGVGAVVLALILFLISGIDGIELVGKYKVVELDGYEVEDFWDKYGFDDELANFYLTFGLGGKVKFDFSLNSKFKNDLEDEELDYLDSIRDSMEDSFAELRWSLDDGEIILENDDDETEERYSLKFNTLTIGKRSEATLLKRAPIIGYICPSMIIRLLALLSLAFGALLLFYKKDIGSVPNIASDICAYCGGPIFAGESFCQNCGSKLESDTPAPRTSLTCCSNCGAEISEGDFFCIMCGTPVGETNTHEKNDLPAEDDVVIKNSASTGETISGKSGRLKTTFRTSGSEGTEPGYSRTEESSISDDEHFKSAGDL